ncbi:MAG: LamG-like jellyroll fold domain-containing protein [Candidatus Eisenbacteria bacterium]
MRSSNSLHLLTVLLFLSAVPALAQTAVDFDGTNDYITFGTAPSLGASTFTLELWFRRDGTGVTTSTGTGGVTAVPLLTKGRGEFDGDNRDMNYFFGIRTTDNVIVADYEEGAGQTTPGLNHPAAGVTPIRTGVWYHAAATFDGTQWQLFLNGNLEATVVVGASHLPRFDSIQHAGLATAMTSTGGAAGYFNGVIDEARVWNRARGQQAVTDSMFLEISSGNGLLGRWGLNEGAGTTANNSVAGGVNGTLTNGPLWVSGSPFALANALALGSSNAYVTFGTASAIGLPEFTIETWFRRDGTGVSVSTGTGGVTAIPLLTKGTSEADGDNRDMNYFLGIRASDGVLVADFEEGATGTSPGLNHPIVGVTPIVTGTWYHAAATYDGTKWQLFLNGSFENELTVSEPPRDDTIQHGALGTSIRSTGTAQGFFNGTLDEARVWNYARTGAEIAATINSQIETAQTGLVARWGLNEGAGTTVHGSAGTSVNGTITGSGWSWTGSAPFNITPPTPPDEPTDLGATALSYLQIQLDWTDNAGNELNYEVDRSIDGEAGPFELRATLGPSTETWIDDDLDAETEYCYRVRATNSYGESGYSNTACDTTLVETDTALDFGGTDAYATFGAQAELGLAEFTLEAWVRRDGAGVSTTTGTGGVTAIPMITKGRGEVDEADNRDMNYFFGILGSNGALAADFEEGAGGASPSLNHPITGVTPLQTGVWYHAAVTYDGTTWQLFLNGDLENELVVGQPPRDDSIQHAALGSALTSTGTAAGFFDGVIDEARVWNYARTQQEVRATINAELAAAELGLVARWSLNEGAGTTVHGSAGTDVDGSILGTNWAWTDGAPFDLVINDPPYDPVLVSPGDMEIDVATSPELCVTVDDPEGDTLSVTFYGRPVTTSAGPDFTLIVLPDTQFYSAEMNGGTNAIFKAQTGWIVDNLATLDIAFVQHLGDIVQNGDTYETEWMRADTSMAILEDSVATGLADGIPYGMCVGNHDQTPAYDPDGTTTYFNQYFGTAEFESRAHYGGHYGANNDDHFILFSASGLDFIAISLEYDDSPEAEVLAWADSLLQAHSGRHGILTFHNLAGTGNPASFSTPGQIIYDALKDNPNLFLMLAGHVSGEGRRSDTYNGHTVHTLMSDYQDRSNGGDGWLRIMRLSPANGTLHVQTYSPTLDQYEVDADSSSQFTLPVDLAVGEQWQAIATVPGVVAGSQVCVPWPGRSPLTEYEWYAVVSDAEGTTTGPIWSFTTIGTATLTVHVEGDGSVERDPDQVSYDLGTPVELTALPAENWEFVEWSGDALGSDNPVTVIMDGPQDVTAHFRETLAPQVTVLYPNGGETLTIDAEVTLQWTANDNVGVTTVDLHLSRSGAGGPFEVIVSGIGNSGSHDWTVSGPATADAFLKVVAHDAAGNDGEDLSDAAFTIQTGGSGIEERLPTEFALLANSANPLRGAGRFVFALPREANVRLTVLDIQGREVAVLAQGGYTAGYHDAQWDGRAAGGRAATGIYFLRLSVPGRTFLRRVLLAP